MSDALPPNPTTVSVLTLMTATSALISKVGDAFKFLVESYDETEFIQAYFSLCLYFAPNTSANRILTTQDFWQTKMQADHDVVKFSHFLMGKAVALNNMHGKEHIVKSDLIAALLNGIETAEPERPEYEHAIGIARLHPVTVGK